MVFNIKQTLMGRVTNMNIKSTVVMPIEQFCLEKERTLCITIVPVDGYCASQFMVTRIAPRKETRQASHEASAKLKKAGSSALLFTHSISAYPRVAQTLLYFDPFPSLTIMTRLQKMLMLRQVMIIVILKNKRLRWKFYKYWSC